MGADPPQRRFTEREVRTILRRVADMRGPGSALGDADGPTLPQLQQAAGELGLDPSLVEAAAREITADREGGFWRRLLGGPASVEAVEVVAGSVSEADWPLLVDEIREASGRLGELKPVGGSFAWSSGAGDTDSLDVTAVPDGEHTRVRVSARFGGLAGLMIVLPGIFGLLAGGIASGLLMDNVHGLSAAAGLAVLFGPPIVALAAGRAAYSRTSARKRRSALEVMATVARYMGRDRTTEAPAADALPEAAPALEPDDAPVALEAHQT